MRFIPLLLLCFLCSLVEVQSQTEYPYLTFLGNTLPNHSYVDLSRVGRERSGSNSNTVQCQTDLVTCCTNTLPHHGHWFAPGGNTRLPFWNESGNMFQSYGTQTVHLRHRNNANGPSGIYQCVIVVHDDSDLSVGEMVYVGLYGSGRGICNMCM